jgi:hypothetical protein
VFEESIVVDNNGRNNDNAAPYFNVTDYHNVYKNTHFNLNAGSLPDLIQSPSIAANSSNAGLPTQKHAKYTIIFCGNYYFVESFASDNVFASDTITFY